jgi:plastocyanin
MNNKALILLTVTVIVAVVAVVGVALGLQHNSAPVACSAGTKPTIHYVTIKNDQAAPAQTNATLCDSLTITNLDNETREVAFGPHEDHVPYDGVAEKVLRHGQSFTVTLNQTGTYRFHDHFHDEVSGNFTVIK